MGLFSKPAASALSAWASANPATAACVGIAATATLAWGIGRTIDRYWETRDAKNIASIDEKIEALEVSVQGVTTTVATGVTQLGTQASAVQQHANMVAQNATNIQSAAGLMGDMVGKLQANASEQKAAIAQLAADLKALGLLATGTHVNTASTVTAVANIQKALDPVALANSYINQAHAANGQTVGQP